MRIHGRSGISFFDGKEPETLDGRWDKHDPRMPANVADLVSQGKCLYYDYPEAAIRDIRSLLSFKKRLKKEEQALQVRIRNQLLAQYFPEMDRHFRTAVSMAVVRTCLDPSLIAGMEYDEFCRTVAPGRVNLRQQRLLQQIWQLAHKSIGCRVGETVPFEAQAMVSTIHHVREMIKAVNDKIEDLCLPFPEYPCLLSIPGFGPEVSSTVLGAIGNPYRFSCGKQVLKMAGYDLSAARSGKTASNVVPVISKERQGGSSICPVSGGTGCVQHQSLFHHVFWQKAPWPATRARDRHQDAGETRSKALDHCLDTDEEERDV